MPRSLWSVSLKVEINKFSCLACLFKIRILRMVEVPCTPLLSSNHRVNRDPTRFAIMLYYFNKNIY